MSIGNSTQRVWIETIVRRAFKNMEGSPGRNVRNLVDMALQFSDGRFQTLFFKTTRRMLQDETSAYYELFRSAVETVDQERLIQFGMNIGYNGCTAGAARIRETEAAQGFNIPWMISLHLDSVIYEANSERFHQVIAEGNELGVYVWQIHCSDRPENLAPLFAAYPDNAFVLYCDTEHINEQMLQRLHPYCNLMLAIPIGQNTAVACTQMRFHRMLYSLYYKYGPQDREKILDGSLFHLAGTNHPIFTVLIPNAYCSAALRDEIHDYVLQTRMQQRYPFIAWDTPADDHFIDSVISGDGCVVGFDDCGNLFTENDAWETPETNLHLQHLQDILRFALPKYKEAPHGR